MFYVVIAGLFDCVISVFAMFLYIYFGKNKNQYELSGIFFFYEQAYFVYLHLEICASQIFMAGNGSVINTIRLACLGKSNGQPFSLSLEGLFFHAPYSVSNQSNKLVENLEMCEIRVNTHTHTHTHTHSDRHFPRVNLLIFKKICKDGNSFFMSFPPFSVFVCPLFIHLQTE